jgi:four helix bundle protein
MPSAQRLKRSETEYFMGQGFRELRVWQEAKELAVDVYLLIRKSPALDKDWGLKDQMQRSAVSIPSNIAEGDARKSDKDSVRFFRIASGSLAELITQLEIAKDLELACSNELQTLIDRLDLLSKSIGALAKSRKLILPKA